MADLVPIISATACLLLAAGALASYRLGWCKMAMMALLWAGIFVALFLLSEWFTAVRNGTVASI